jgi:hypothetical protein
LKREKVENQHAKVSLVEEQAVSYLKKNGATDVKELYDVLKDGNPSLSELEATDLVWRLAGEGEVAVEDIPPATDSLGQYVRIWERNLWFYSSVGISLMAVLVIYAVPPQLPLIVLRWVLGSAFVLFIPGYVTMEILFPSSRDWDGVERFALSVGLSLVLVMLVGLLLNYTPWGIRLTPIVISLALLTVGFSLTALYRKFRLSAESRGYLG